MNLGGAPLMVPILNENGTWRREVPQTSYHKRLWITQVLPLSVEGITSWKADDSLAPASALAGQFNARAAYALQVRLTNSLDNPGEEGSSGPRDAAIRSLLYGLDQDGIRRVAPFVEIDRMQGEFAGGRWVFANIEGSLGPAAVRALVERAANGATELVVRPTFACYRRMEVPSFTVELRRPRGDTGKFVRGDAFLEITNDGGKRVAELRAPMISAGTLMTGHAILPETGGLRPLPPGFYRVHAAVMLRSANGDARPLCL